MNKIELKEFQERTIDFISSKLKEQEIVKLQSPTGSGKTIMTAKIVENFLKNYDKNFFQKTSIIYISLSSGGLDYQGYKKITNLLEKNFVSGFTTKYIGTGSKIKGTDLKSNNYIQGIEEFKRNTIYFMGWGILTANSKAFKEGEEDNIFNVIRRTKSSNTKIFLIIDEAHRDNPLVEENKTSSLERKEFLNELAPEKQLWMSATFLSLKKQITPDYVVNSDEVKAEGVIKQDIIVNADVDSKWDNDSINKKLIRDALNKKREIEISISKAKQKFNPLILIQIPDGNPKYKNINVNDYYLKLIDEVLMEKGLKKEFDYGVYLSEIKTNTKNEIESMNSPLQIIVFKQAIATGWDVPRANILVKLRKPSTRTDSFDLQTLGRILRNPFLKVYKRGGNLTKKDVYNLNNAFVFTNDKDYSSFLKNEHEIIEKNINLEKQKYLISKKAKKIELKLNYLSIKNINDNVWDQIKDNIFNNKEYKEFTNYLISEIDKFYNNDISLITKTKKIDAAKISEGKLRIENDNQQFIDFKNKNKIDMYFTYIEFLEATNGSKLIEKIVRNLSKIKECKYTIKKLFYYFSNKYNELFKDEETLKEKINNIIYDLLKPYIKYEIKENFILQDKMFYYKKNTEKISNKYEQNSLINSYLLEIKTTSNEFKPIFDSLQEQIFYNWISGWKWLDYEKKNFIFLEMESIH